VAAGAAGAGLLAAGLGGSGLGGGADLAVAAGSAAGGVTVAILVPGGTKENGAPREAASQGTCLSPDALETAAWVRLKASSAGSSGVRI
jgi:hypothetical protein